MFLSFGVQTTIKVLYYRKQDVCFQILWAYLVILKNGNLVYSSANLYCEWRQFFGWRLLHCWLLNLVEMNLRCLLLLVRPVTPKATHLACRFINGDVQSFSSFLILRNFVVLILLKYRTFVFYISMGKRRDKFEDIASNYDFYLLFQVL